MPRTFEKNSNTVHTPHESESFVVAVSGTSMKPTFIGGELIRLYRNRKAQTGDFILTRRSEGNLVLHRKSFSRYEERNIVSKGDFCRITDSIIHPADIMGSAPANSQVATPGECSPVPLQKRLLSAMMTSAALLNDRRTGSAAPFSYLALKLLCRLRNLTCRGPGLFRK